MEASGSSAAEGSRADRDGFKQKIKTAYAKLTKNLTKGEVNYITSELYSRSIILTEECEVIQGSSTDTESAQALCNIIRKKGEFDCEIFVKLLREISREKLVDLNSEEASKEASTPDKQRYLAQLEKMIKDLDDLVKRQREEYDLHLQELKNQEEKLQRQQVLQDEKEKSWNEIKAQLKKRIKDHEDLAKRQIEEYDLQLQELQNQKEKLQCQQVMQDEKEKSLKVLQAQLEKRIKDHEDLVKRQREEYSLQLQELKNQEEKLQCQQVMQDEKEKSLKVLQENLDKQTKELQKNEAAWQFMTGIQLRVPEHPELPVKCMDVAVTADGHLLLAARAHGMLECDGSGRPLSRWTPAMRATGDEGDVCTVDELQDGRVAVGVRGGGRCTVQLLQRSAAASESWQQQQDFQLQGPPWHLSVHAQLVAVAEEGRQLVLLSLTDGKELLRHDPDYSISSVAATADAVITASLRDSFWKVQLSDGKKHHVVDSYSHSGHLLWRQAFNEPVWDLHWSQLHSVVYLALKDSDRVTAIRAVDGQQVSELLNSSHGLKMPKRLSLSRGPRTALAVLHGDLKTVTVYPALGSGGSK